MHNLNQDFDQKRTNILLLAGLILSSAIYLLINIGFAIQVTSLSDPIRSLVQGFTFIFIPFVWIVFIVNPLPIKASIKSFFGTEVGYSKRNLIVGFIEGNLLFIVIFAPLFLLGRINNTALFSWFEFSKNPNIMIFLIGTFISVTSVEFTTKGYVMLSQISMKADYNKIFFLGMVAWTLGHIVEFLWLRVYVNDLNAAFLLIFAGIVSTYAVLRSHNFFGIWIGHLNLNVVIIIVVNFF